jgi:hypothetical protein
MIMSTSSLPDCFLYSECTLQQDLDTIQRMGKSISDAIQPGHKENYTAVQVYHPRTGTEQRQLLQEPRFEHP